MSNSSLDDAEGIKPPASELGNQPCVETDEDLKRTIAERRKALIELAAYDQEIDI